MVPADDNRPTPRTALLAATLTMLFAIHPLVAGGRRRTAAASPSASAVSIAFTDAAGEGSDALVDVGTVRSSQIGRVRSARVVRVTGVRIGPPSSTPAGTATLRAYLSSDTHAVVRVGSQRLSTAPAVVNAHATIGVVIPYQISIDVPPDAADGPLTFAIQWEATTN